MVVRDAVEARDQIVAVRPHLASDLGVARFGWLEQSGESGGQDQRERDQCDRDPGAIERGPGMGVAVSDLAAASAPGRGRGRRRHGRRSGHRPFSALSSMRFRT